MSAASNVFLYPLFGFGHLILLDLYLADLGNFIRVAWVSEGDPLNLSI